MLAEMILGGIKCTKFKSKCHNLEPIKYLIIMAKVLDCRRMNLIFNFFLGGACPQTPLAADGYAIRGCYYKNSDAPTIPNNANQFIFLHTPADKEHNVCELSCTGDGYI